MDEVDSGGVLVATDPVGYNYSGNMQSHIHVRYVVCSPPIIVASY